MSNKNTAAKTVKPTTATPNAIELRAAVKETLEAMLDAGEIDIPDECVEGKVSAKLASMEAQVKSLTARLAELSARLEGKPGATDRVDVLAKPDKKKK